MEMDVIDIGDCIRQVANQKIKGKAKYIYDGQAVRMAITVSEIEHLPLKLTIHIPWGTVYGRWKKHKKGGKKK